MKDSWGSEKSYLVHLRRDVDREKKIITRTEKAGLSSGDFGWEI